jgi:signal transduction histidine kinase
METSTTNKHLGLLVMRERAEMVGGSLTIKSSRGHGTKVRADIPLEASTRD